MCIATAGRRCARGAHGRMRLPERHKRGVALLGHRRSVCVCQMLPFLTQQLPCFAAATVRVTAIKVLTTGGANNFPICVSKDLVLNVTESNTGPAHAAVSERCVVGAKCACIMHYTIHAYTIHIHYTTTIHYSCTVDYIRHHRQIVLQIHIGLRVARATAHTVCAVHIYAWWSRFVHRHNINGCSIQGCPVKSGTNVYTNTLNLSAVKYILDLMNDGVSWQLCELQRKPLQVAYELDVVMKAGGSTLGSFSMQFSITKTCWTLHSMP